MDKQYESRLQKVRRSTEVWMTYQNGVLFDDSCGWRNRMTALAELLPNDEMSGILLTGPEGCGKHTCAANFVSSLDEDRFSVLYFSTPVMRARQSGGHSFPDFISAVLDEAYDSGKGLCMLFEIPEDIDTCDETLDLLSSAVCEFTIQRDEYPPLILVLIKNSTDGIPPMLCERLLRCPMTLPTEEQRLEFLQNRAKAIKKYVSFEKLAEISEGFSYRALLNLSRNLDILIDAERIAAVSDDDMNTMADALRESSAGVTAAQPADSGFAEVVQVLRKIADRKPEVITVAQSTAESSADATDSSSAPAIDVQKELEESMKMPVKELGSELFGEEFMSQYL